MNRDYLEIVLVDNDVICQALYNEALKDNRFRTSLTCLGDGDKLTAYLDESGIIPDLVFLELPLSLKQGITWLYDLRHDPRLSDTTLAVCSTMGTDKQMEELLIHGANVFFKKTYDINTLRKLLTHICNLHWQYETSGLNKGNFLINLNRIRSTQRISIDS